MQLIINHRPPNEQIRTFEMLAKHAIPSLPGKTVAGVVFDMLARYVPTKNDTDLPLYVCNTLLELWSICLQDDLVSTYLTMLHHLITDSDSMLHCTYWPTFWSLS